MCVLGSTILPLSAIHLSLSWYRKGSSESYLSHLEHSLVFVPFAVLASYLSPPELELGGCLGWGHSLIVLWVRSGVCLFMTHQWADGWSCSCLERVFRGVSASGGTGWVPRGNFSESLRRAQFLGLAPGGSKVPALVFATQVAPSLSFSTMQSGLIPVPA